MERCARGKKRRFSMPINRLRDSMYVFFLFPNSTSPSLSSFFLSLLFFLSSRTTKKKRKRKSLPPRAKTMRLGTTGSRAAATASASSSMSALPRCRPALAAARRKTSSPRAQSAAAAVVASACSSSLSLSPSSLSLARRRRHQQHRRFSTFVVRAAASFDSLSQSLSKAWDAVRIDGKLTAENIKGPMREIRRALLEADVSFFLSIWWRVTTY